MSVSFKLSCWEKTTRRLKSKLERGGVYYNCMFRSCVCSPGMFDTEGGEGENIRISLPLELLFLHKVALPTKEKYGKQDVYCILFVKINLIVNRLVILI